MRTVRSSGLCGIILTFLLLAMTGPAVVTAQSSFCSTPGITVSVEECEALMMLYTSTNGPGWTNKTGWGSAVDVGSRYGVTTEDVGGTQHVTRLTLSSNNLIGSVPEAFSSLAYLEHAYLAQNSLISLPDTIGALSVLQTLDIQSNLLAGLPESIGDLDQLTILYLQNNRLTGLPDSIGDLASLDLLYLQNNQLSLLPNTLTNLPELDILDVSYNQLVSLPTSIGNLSDLDVIKATHNDIISLPGELGNLPNLASLDLEQNNISSLPSTLGNSSTLTSLDLDNNALTSLPESLDQVTSLQTLYLQNNEISAISPTLDGFPSLIRLHLHDNELTTFPDFIAKSTNLEYLYLNDNLLVGTFPSDFSQLTKLKRLYTYSNYLDRTNTHNAMIPSALQSRYNSIYLAFSMFQGDITSPEIALESSYSPLLSENISLDISVDENSYAVNQRGFGMPYTFSGAGLCQSLLSGTITVNTGIVSLDLGVVTTGVYHNCTLLMEDHEGNLSNTVMLPSFVFSENLTDFCDHPDIEIPLAECQALVEFYAATNGPGRTNKTNRLISTDIESWFGVKLGVRDDEQHVIGLYLHKIAGSDQFGPSRDWVGNNLSGILPPSFANLTYLEELNLSNNAGLVGTLPSDFGNLSALEDIFLQSCSFEGSLPPSLGELQGLQTLDIRGNNFGGQLSGRIGDLTALSALNLGENQFSGPLPASLANLTSLRYFNIEGNEFSGQLPSYIGSRSLLQYLYLGENKFVGNVPTGYTSLGGLEVFDVHGNNLDRNNNHSVKLAAPLQTWVQGVEVVRVDSQGDSTAPVLVGTGSFPWLVSEPQQFPITIVENSYAVDLDGEGMDVVFSGSSATCLQLSGSDISISSGSATVTIDVTEPGLYEGCLLGVEDHGGNISNYVPLPRFGYTTTNEAVCFNPGLTVSVDECLGLMKLYSSTNGQGWYTKTGRGDTPDVGSRYGVTTVDIGTGTHVVTIDLEANNLNGVVEIDAHKLPYLQHLTLGENALTGIETIWSGFSNLSVLALNDNLFAQQLPAGISHASSLTAIDLSNNSFYGQLQSSRSSFAQVEYVDLSNNELSGELPTRIAGREPLRELYFANNEFVGSIPFVRTSLDSLTHVDVSGNALDRDADHTLALSASMNDRVSSILYFYGQDQSDTIAPLVVFSGTLPDMISNAFSGGITVQENSYAVDSGGNAMEISFGGNGLCPTLQTVQDIASSTGYHEITLIPGEQGTYAGCEIMVTDHGGNQGAALLPDFVYAFSCGNGVIDSGEVCDEGRYCDDGVECTDDVSLCPSSCKTRFVDNCNPFCNVSVCGDGFIDEDGLDNIGGTIDDEYCDEGRYCNDGTVCTNDSSVCLGGAAECKTRLVNGCNPYCGLGACGDGYTDLLGVDGQPDTADDEECDDGNFTAGDGCSSLCTLESCGDGLHDPDGPDNTVGTQDDEECDLGPGNGILGGTCLHTCKQPSGECQYCYELCDGGTGSHSIFLLIDVSGSMGSNDKLIKAKDGAQEFVRLVSESALTNTGFTSKIGVVSYSSETVDFYAPTQNYQEIETLIEGLEAGGGTNFGDPILDAVSYFSANDQSYLQHIILLSDGLPTVSDDPGMSAEEWAVYAADQAKSNGVSIYTISMEQTFEGNELMRRLSSSPLQNVAPGKSVDQSSTSWWRYPEYAIDSDISWFSTTQTNYESEAWWDIDLGQVYAVDHIKLWNRTGNSSWRTSNYHILMSETLFDSEDLDTTLADPNVTSIHETGEAQRPSTYEIDDQIRYLRVQLEGTNNLSLGEMQILACMTGTGTDCESIFTFEDYEATAIELIYSHIFGSIHCGCNADTICGLCGDGITDDLVGEQCDEGSSCNDGTDCTENPGICPNECQPRFSQECTNTCFFTSCGDGVVQTPNHYGEIEQCDDGNAQSGDGCTSLCQIESCGDGYYDQDGADNIWLTDDDEQCDDGNAIDTDDCSNACTLNTQGGIDGLCHDFGLLYSFFGDGSNPPNQSLLCDAGTAQGFTYNEGLRNRTRYCIGENGGNSVECVAEESYCGDGVTQAYSFVEACDDGNSFSGDGCSHLCEFEAPLLPPITGSTACVDGLTPVFQVNEPMPLVRQLSPAGGVDPVAQGCTDRQPGTIIPGGSLQCHFTVYHGNELAHSQIGDHMSFPCISGIHNSPYSGLLLDYLSDHQIASEFVLGHGFLGSIKDLGNSPLGKYRLSLDSVSYTYCSINENNEQVETAITYGLAPEQGPLCAVRVSVTEPYLTQKGSSFGTIQPPSFETYVAADGSSLLYDGIADQVKHAQVSSYSRDVVQYLTQKFVNDYRRSAKEDAVTFGANRVLKKVPYKDIYFFKGSDTKPDIRISGQLLPDLSRSITVIVENADLIVEGNLEGNGIYIVKNGKVVFDHMDCDASQVVEGIYVTNEGFELTNTQNYLTRGEWCRAGNFLLRGMLVGPGIDETISNKRRALLDVINMPLLENTDVIAGLDVTQITTQQKSALYSSSAVSIQTDPSARRNLPEGVTELFDAMLLYKE